MLRNYGKLLLRVPLQSLEAVDAIGTDEPTAFRDGIYLSSWDLFKELNRSGNISEKDRSRMHFAYSKYWIRSCTRCTPYATFAGFAMVNILPQPTRIVLDNKESYGLQLRVDVDFVNGLAHRLSLVPQIREQIRFYTNNSLYELTDSYRYAEYKLENGRRKYEVTSLKKNPYLKDILTLAKNGATVGSLQVALTKFEGITLDDANEFITELIESQLLISDLETTVTGEEPFDQLIKKLSGIVGFEHTLQKLVQIQSLLSSVQKDTALIHYINEILSQLTEKPMLNSFVQADLLPKLAQSTINDGLVEEITHQLQDLFLLSRPADHPEIENFKNAFIAKYEDAEMPLALVLDAESGIGYGDFNEDTSANNVLIGDLVFQNRQSVSGSEFDEIQQLSLNKYYDFLKNKRSHISIDKSDLTPMKKKMESYQFSTSIYALGSLMQLSDELGKDHFLFDVAAFGGTSGANLFGKFTHSSKELAALSSRILKKEEEQYPDAIFAEIVHLPEAQVGNILLRPVLRPYEIPYVGRSGVDQDHQILLEDLYVSIRQGEVILVSKKLGKRIIPKLTTAHNFNYKGLPVYKFLCSLQSHQNAKMNIWDWGNLDSLRFLPRVVYRNLLLKKATWKFTADDIIDLPLEKEDIQEYFSKFRLKWELPMRVSYLEEDNKLLIDFSQDHGIRIFVYYLKKLKRIIVEEYLFTPENCIVKDREGKSYTNEVVIPFFEDKVELRSASLKLRVKNQGVKGKFIPGSEWLYFKIYTGLKFAEEILKNELFRFVDEGLTQGLFEKFFFIRFKDDGPHLRIRFYNAEESKQHELMRAFLNACQPLINNNYIQRVVLDTYVRETDRYGEDLITHSEDLFFHDSLSVMRLLKLIDGPDIDIYRMIFAIRGINILLDDFKFTFMQKEKFSKYLQGMFFKEFGAGDHLQSQLNDKYRSYQSLIFSHMDADSDKENDIVDAIEIFKERSNANILAVKRILSEVNAEQNWQRIEELLASYIHMFVNRLFIGKQRMNELVIYHFLERYHRSRSAILKRDQTSTTSISTSNTVR
ncbi:hypothetical protein DYU05_06060 [Mucilaginibacter terrenus]|uniref:Lantibiotic dehydratase n=1 Tax=Mucilaginibacter terrenus TaxID=2482727 RepID=A0A3E2NVY9_9SPHI|nr:lantibiotic dehydratase [Mucilaginibacter terrenus]RFZ85162.1 hypothetical protein DYU05_06060 [Mucilaginibacter terrenus]